MADPKKLRDQLLALQGLDSAGPSSAQVAQFRNQLTAEKRRVKRWEWWTVALVWLWGAAMLALCMLERLWERLNIPFVVASLAVTALMWGLWLPILVRLARRLRRSRHAVQRLNRLLPEYVPPRIVPGTWLVRCGSRRYIHGLKLLGFAAVVWVLFALGGMGVYLLLTQRLTTAPLRFQTVMAFCVLLGIVVTALRTPLEELTATTHVNPRVWWCVPGLPAWRLPRRALAGLGGGMALACVTLAVFLLYQENTLHAKVLRGFEDARSFHVQGYRFEEGQPVLGTEIWHLKGRGTRIRDYTRDGVRELYENGRDQWQHTEGSDFVVKKIGAGSIVPRELTEPCRYLKQCRRNPEGDRLIDGDLCRLYETVQGAMRSRFWIDEQTRFRRYEEHVLAEGIWQADEVAAVTYDVAVDPDWVTPRFGPDIRIIEPGAMLTTRYRVDTALAMEEVLGLQFAVHEVQRCRGNLIVTCSLRPTEEALRQIDSAGLERIEHGAFAYGHFSMGSWWQRHADGTLETRSYAMSELGEVVQDHIHYTWTVMRPVETWPGVDERLDVCGYVHTRAALAELRRQRGDKSYENIRPILTVDLPEERVALDALREDLHAIQREVTGLHLSAQHLRREIPRESFQAELDQVLQGLQPYQTLWDEVGSEIQIQLVDVEGNPVPKVRVGPTLTMRQGQWQSPAVSDANGEAGLRGSHFFEGRTAQHVTASVSAVLPSRGMAVTRDITCRDFGKTLRLVMEPACRVTAKFAAPGRQQQDPSLPLVHSRVYLHEAEGAFRGVRLLTRTHFSIVKRVLDHQAPEGTLDIWLPAGGYELNCDAHDSDENWTVEGHRRFAVPKRCRELDLGEIVLRLK